MQGTIGASSAVAAGRMGCETDPEPIGRGGTVRTELGSGGRELGYLQGD